MPLHLNPNVKGRYVKLGNLGFVRLKDIDRGAKTKDGNKDVVEVHLKKGGPPLIYRGDKIDHVKDVLDKEAGK